MDITKDPRLSKAPLLHIRLSRGKWMVSRFRLANCHQIFLGPFSICIRARWLEEPARQRLETFADPADGWRCGARQRHIGPDTQDCDWPVCGCDPYASKVLDAIAESGFEIVKR